MAESNPVGFVALGRPTFDIEFASEMAEAALRTLGAQVSDVVGDAGLCLDGEQVASQRDAMADCDTLVVFQATFADSTLLTTLTDGYTGQIVLWAVPEERTGGRLRLNSLCGINLAAYVLARRGQAYGWIYRHPDDPETPEDLNTSLTRVLPARSRHQVAGTDDERPDLSLDGLTVAVIGDRPAGFEPCDYDPAELESRFGVRTEQVSLGAWFETSHAVPDEEVSSLRTRASALGGIEEVDSAELDRSLELGAGLAEMATAGGWDGVATRCWPECFTEYGGAACAGNSMLSSSGVPGCCEADVYGVVTALLLQQAGEGPAFVADLVDADRSDDTVVFWHCGQAPAEMAAADPEATVHSNRQKPLLYQFALRPGRITIARVSQARSEPALVVAGGEVLEAPRPFSGTAGVARLDSGVEAALGVILGEGLEHHYGIVYGDHRQPLVAFARDKGLRLIEF